jgi:hypothetical protein
VHKNSERFYMIINMTCFYIKCGIVSENILLGASGVKCRRRKMSLKNHQLQRSHYRKFVYSHVLYIKLHHQRTSLSLTGSQMQLIRRDLTRLIGNDFEAYVKWFNAVDIYGMCRKLCKHLEVSRYERIH